MARYFPSNKRFALGSLDFLQDPNVDALANSLARQDAYTDAELLSAGASNIQAIQDGQYNVINAQGQGQRAQSQADSNFWTSIGTTALSSAAGPLAKHFAPNFFGGNKVNDLSGLDYNDPSNFSYNAAPYYLDTPDIDTSWGGWDSI